MFKCDVCGKWKFVTSLDRQWAGLVCNNCSTQMQCGVHPDEIRKEKKSE